MTKEEAIKYLQQLYPNGGHCWLDEQRMEAIGMAVKALQEEPVELKEVDFENYNKVQKIRQEVERIQLYTQSEVLKQVLDYIDEVKKEPVSEDLEKIVEEIAEPTILNAYGTKELARRLRNTIYGTSVSENLEEASKNYALNNTPWDDCKDEIQESFKAGAQWQKTKDESVTKDLGEYINELSKQFPEVSFAKLSRIAVRVAKWQKEHLWKPADCDDLPEIDREVIVLTQPCSDDDKHLRVVFAHRPNKYTKVWNSDLGEEQVVEIERHGKGGWNIPNVKWWLDCSLPNMED